MTKGENKDNSLASQVLSLISEMDSVNSSGDPFLLYLRGLILSSMGQKKAASTYLAASVREFPWNMCAWNELQM